MSDGVWEHDEVTCSNRDIEWTLAAERWRSVDCNDSGLSIFTQFSGSENYEDMGMAAKAVLSNHFSNAHVTFNYDQMFQQGNRRLTSYGKNNLNHSK